MTESYEFRTNGEYIYSKDNGFGEFGKLLKNQYGTSKINGTWSLDDIGNIICGGPVNVMRPENGDLIDNKGERWSRVR